MSFNFREFALLIVLCRWSSELFIWSTNRFRYILILFALIMIDGCSLLSKYPLHNFYLIEGSWKYQRQPGNQTWQLIRRVLEKKQEDNFIWYKVETEKKDSDGKSSSVTQWYSLQEGVILTRNQDSEKGTVIFGLPGEVLESTYKEYDGFPRATHERSKSVIEASEEVKAKLPCPCLGVETLQLSTRAGSFDMSSRQVVWYAKDIGVVLYEWDSFNPQGKKDVLIDYHVGNTRL